MTKRQYIFDTYKRGELTHALKRAEPVIFDDVLRFLENDPRTFGSGYIKQNIWKYVTRYPLNDTHVRRLEAAALLYLFRPMCPEFHRMCLTMSRIATGRFWEQVRQCVDSDQVLVAINASCLLPYADSVVAGERVRLKNKVERSRAMIAALREHPPAYFSAEDFVMLLQEPQYWPDGVVQYKSSNTGDKPVVWNTNTYDEFLTTVDWSKCNHDVILPKLKAILDKTELELAFSGQIWTYTLYLLQQISDPKTVSIVSEYLHKHVAYRFESITKDTLMRAGLKVLRHYNTVEAQQTLAEYHEYDEEFLSLYKNYVGGWSVTYP